MRPSFGTGSPSVAGASSFLLKLANGRDLLVDGAGARLLLDVDRSRRFSAHQVPDPICLALLADRSKTRETEGKALSFYEAILRDGEEVAVLGRVRPGEDGPEAGPYRTGQSLVFGGSEREPLVVTDRREFFAG